MALQLSTNPLREGLVRERVADPAVFVLFGGAGDLSRRKLMPALFSLYCEGLLPNGFAIIGLGRRDYGDDGYRNEMRDAVEKSGLIHEESCSWDTFAEGISYVTVDYDNPDNYSRIADKLQWADQQRGTSGNRLFYLA